MKKTTLILFLVMLLCFSFSEEASVSFDFVLQDIQDIVYAVSLAQDISIVCDDTVVGKTSFRFSGSDFEKAGEAFLRSNRLYAKKENDVIVLSKVHIEHHVKTDTFSINAYDIMPSVLFNKISEYTHIPISYELLPTTNISLHVKNVSIQEAVTIVMKSFPNYAVFFDNGSISVIKNQFSQNAYTSLTKNDNEKIAINAIDNLYTVDISQGSFFESLENLFLLSSALFCNLLDTDRLITRLVFEDSDFESVLTMLCAQAEAIFTYHDGVYTIFGSENASDALKSANSFWKTLSLKYINSNDFTTLFQKRFSRIPFIRVSDSKVQIKVTKKEESEVDIFVNLCDKETNTHLVDLQYISSEKFLNHLPPNISSEQFSDLGTGHSLLFEGSKDAFAVLNEYIRLLDKPAVIIGYDLLVLQVQESSSLHWNPRFALDSVSLGDRTKASAHLGSVLALSLDIVSVFGYTFASELQTAITDNKAEIYVDTKLQGISGSPIHFQNTNTFRYQDTAIDPDTGNPVYSGITREIIAGLVLNIEGWVSGDGMVTTKVTASLSRRGADVSDSGNPPPTSEKVVTTEVRGKSGEPIILTGLVQNDSTFIEEKTPLLSRIPLLGWFFKSKDKHEEKTEMIIYLVPHVETRVKEGI